MPNSRDPVEYKKRAEQWRTEGERLPPGETREAYFEIAEGYEHLAEILERSPSKRRSG
jgi:hypothetical protein